MRDVYVLGIGQTNFGKMPGLTPIQLGIQAAKSAIQDAGIEPRKIEVAYGGRSYDDTQTAENILRYVGIAGVPMYNTENACTTGATVVNQLWKDIAYGIHDIGIAVTCESMTTSSKAGKLVGAAEGDLNGTLGLTMPSYFALMAYRLMEERGATMEDLAYPSVKNHRNACMNPYAMYRKALTTEDVMNAKMICDPLTSLHCCPVTDGAASIILCTGEIARRYTTKMIKLASSLVLSAYYEAWDYNLLDNPLIKELAKRTYDAAGIGPEDLDLIELHDAFAPEEISAVSCLGLCKTGEEISYIRSGASEISGKCPINPSGGLLSLGHPLGASGARVVCEVAQHLRETAGDRQVKGARVGMAEMIGGYLTGLGSSIAGINLLTR
jgi:benzoylsuccinyl-CoA thiolase BbsB subunit